MRRIDKFATLLNVLCIGVYLFFSARFWAPSAERGLLGGPGDPIIWGLTAFPVLVLAFLFNLIWLVFSVSKRGGASRRHFIVLWFCVLAIWLGAIKLDRFRQYNGSAVLHQKIKQ
jgi:hypothetical protein